MSSSLIRPLVICIFQHHKKILVAESYDPVTNQLFYRPLGGAIKFGEYSQAALQREIMEEIGENIHNLNFLGTIENIFVFNQQKSHEIVLVYDGEFIKQEIYRKESISGYEEEDGVLHFKAVWKHLEDFRGSDKYPLYPDGLLQLL